VTRRQFEETFGMRDRTWVRWIVAGRKMLGLQLRYESEGIFIGVDPDPALVLTTPDKQELGRWVEALEDFYCFFATCRRGHRTSDDEGLCDARVA
jgi:hypothetical protein